MQRKFLLAAALLSASQTFAQELNCNVQVLTPTIQGSDKRIYQTLQTSVFEFLNTRKWTEDNFLNQERIECSVIITIGERVSTDEFKATVQVQSTRPAYKTSYNSTMLNYKDPDFSFRYLEYQPLDYNDGSAQSNLTSVLAYYAYLIIGLDYDSFAPSGGTTYFLKAQTVVSNAQNLPDKGWKAFESDRNRYWLTENLLNTQFLPLRECLYNYHRKGFDVMSENIQSARTQISESLHALKRVSQEKPNSFLLQQFFNAKADELVNLYSQANQSEKTDITQLLNEIDPGNSSKYQAILTGK